MKNVEGIKVVLEASAEQLKKELRQAQNVAQSYIRGIDSTVNQSGKELGGVAGQVKMVADVIREAQRKVRESISSGEMGAGIREQITQAQVDAGVREYSESYLQLQDAIRKTEAEIEKLQAKASGFSDSDKYQVSDKYKAMEKNIAGAEKELDVLQKKKEKMEQSGKAFITSEEYDGTIIRITNLQEKLDELNAKKKQYAAVGFQDSNMQSVIQEITETKSELNSLEMKLQELKSVGDDKIPTEKYEQLTDEIEKTKEQLQSFMEQKRQMEADGSNMTESLRWQENQRSIEDAAARLQQYREMASEQVNDGTYTQPVEQGFSSGSYIQTAAVAARAAISSIGPAVAEVRNQVAAAIQQVPVLGRVATEASYLAKKGFGLMQFAASKLTSGIKKAGGAAASLIQKFASGVPILNRFTGGVNKNSFSLKGAVKSLLKYGLGIRSVYALVNKLRRAMVEGFKNLSQFSDTTNANLSLLSSQMSQFKNSLATAFDPILTVVTPILSQVIDYAIGAANAIAQFFASLTGAKTYTVAKRVATDYAASLGDTSDKASEANESAKELQRTLMGFDEVNKLDDNSGSSGSGGSGGGSGTSGADMFTTETINGQFADFANMVKDAWRNADFTEIGAIMGEKLNAALETIPWDAIKQTSSKIAKSIATFLNGFIESTNWELVGKTYAEGINTVLEFGYTFVTTFKWDSLGSAIASGITGIVNNLEWEKLGKTFSEGVKGILSTANTAISETDWNAFGKSVGKAITNIDWGGILSGVGKLIFNAIMAGLDFASGLVSELKSAVKNIDWTSVDWGKIASSIGELFIKALSLALDLAELGGDVIAGLLQGMLDALSDIGTWIKTNIVDKFVSSIKNFFGIHSPSTVMAEIGGFLIAGLQDGLVNAVAGIGEWLKSNVVDKITGGFEAVKELTVSIGGKVLDTFNSAKDAFVGLKDSKVVKTVTGVAESAFNTVKDAFTNLKPDTATKTIAGIAENTFDTVKTAFTNLKPDTATKTIAGFAQNTFDTVKSAFNGLISNNAVKTIKGVQDSKKTFDSTKEKYNALKSQTITKTIKGGQDKKKTFKSIKQLFNSVKSVVATKTISGKTDSSFNSVKSAYNNITSKNAKVTLVFDYDAAMRKLKADLDSYWDKDPFSRGRLNGNTGTFATGGFPEEGPFWMNRGEIAGKFSNGKGVVANNQQITDGIANAVGPAVYGAMVSAMQASGNGNGNVTITLEGDAKGLFRVVKTEAKKYTASHGTPAFPV